MWSHGIAVSGSSQNDQWNDVEISSNAIINIRAALAGDGRGIEISRYAQRPVVENNLIYNTAGENLVFESRAANRD